MVDRHHHRQQQQQQQQQQKRVTWLYLDQTSGPTAAPSTECAPRQTKPAPHTSPQKFGTNTRSPACSRAMATFTSASDRPPAPASRDDMRLDLAFASKTYRDTRLQTDFGRVMMQNRDTCASMALSSASCRELQDKKRHCKPPSPLVSNLLLLFGN